MGHAQPARRRRKVGPAAHSPAAESFSYRRALHAPPPLRSARCPSASVCAVVPFLPSVPLFPRCRNAAIAVPATCPARAFAASFGGAAEVLPQMVRIARRVRVPANSRASKAFTHSSRAFRNSASPSPATTSPFRLPYNQPLRKRAASIFARKRPFCEGA